MRTTSFLLGIWLLLAIYAGACSTVVRGYVQPKERSNMPVDPAVDTLVKTFQTKKTGRTKFQVYALNNRKVLVRQFRYWKDSTYWVSTSSGFFKKDEGFRYRYYPNGAVAGIVPLVDGKAEGMGRYFYKDGRLEAERLFKNDRQHGTTRMFWENGRLFGAFEYAMGRLVSVHGFFDPSGKSLNKGSFENGDGEVWFYDDKGINLELIHTYRSGKLIKSRSPEGRKLPPGHCRC